MLILELFFKNVQAEELLRDQEQSTTPTEDPDSVASICMTEYNHL